MQKIGFDNDKYLTMQSEHIRDRISKFDNKLYLEFGGTQDGSLFSPIAAVYPMIFTAVFLIILPLVEAKILRVKMNKSL